MERMKKIRLRGGNPESWLKTIVLTDEYEKWNTIKYKRKSFVLQDSDEDKESNSNQDVVLASSLRAEKSAPKAPEKEEHQSVKITRNLSDKLISRQAFLLSYLYMFLSLPAQCFRFVVIDSMHAFLENQVSVNRYLTSLLSAVIARILRVHNCNWLLKLSKVSWDLSSKKDKKKEISSDRDTVYFSLTILFMTFISK